MMEKILNEYIERKKTVSPSPLLVERIVQSVNEASDRKEKSLSTTFLVAASFAAVILMGIALGNSYQPKTSDESVLIINDKHIEHLHIFKTHKTEQDG